MQVEESGGRDPLHPRADQNTCVFHLLLFTWCRWKRLVAVTLSILVLVKIHVFFISYSSLGAGGREWWSWPSLSSCWSKYMCFSSPALHLVQVEESGGRDPLHPRASHHGGRGSRPHPQEERYDLRSIIIKLCLKRFVCLLQKLPPIQHNFIEYFSELPRFFCHVVFCRVSNTLKGRWQLQACAEIRWRSSWRNYIRICNIRKKLFIDWNKTAKRLPVLSLVCYSIAEFTIPDWGDKVNFGIGLSYRPARLHNLAGRAGVDYIPKSGTMNLAKAGRSSWVSVFYSILYCIAIL